MILSVDPGLRHCGVALWRGHDLVVAQLVTGEKDTGVRDSEAWWTMVDNVVTWAKAYGPLDVIVSEFPKVYSVGKSKGDPEDLLQLAAIVGGIVCRERAVSKIVRPYEWKGQVPKDIMTGRILSKLSPLEQRIIPKLAASKLHNVIDAIGIGLRHVGRL